MEDEILKQVKNLNEQCQFQSAVELANLIIFKSQKKFSFYAEYARSLHGIGRYRKATKYCAKAMDLSCSAPEQYKLILLAAECHQKIKNYKVSYQLYKKVPYSQHSTKSLMDMAKLIIFLSAAENSVIDILYQILKRNPYCIEAAIELIHLGHFSPALILNNSSPESRDNLSKFYSLYLSRYAETYNIRHTRDIEMPIRLEVLGAGVNAQDWQINPNSDLIMLRARALNAVYERDFREAVRIYKRITSIDKDVTDDMHFYAYSLKNFAPNSNYLKVLTYLLLHLAPGCAETWLVVSIWYSTKKQYELSLQNVQRSISLNSRLWLSYQFRAEILAIKENYLNAFRSIRQAWSLCKKPCVAENYLELAIKTDFNNLMVHANEIYKNLGGVNSALALALLGKAQASCSKSHIDTQKILEKAIQMDPKCAIAYSALAFWQYESSLSDADLDSNKQFEKAIATLQKGIACNPCDRLYMDLGELYLKREKFHDSLSCFLKVFQNDPSNERAASLIEEVQSLIKGQLSVDHEYIQDE